MAEPLSADYLVIGAGAMGMAFVDTIISDTAKTVIIVDRYSRPGGHWTTAYPFVRLHQPSTYYGVNSRHLGSGKIDKVGWNRGLYELASRDEVTAYFSDVMRQTLLPSGRVQYFPKHEHLGEGLFKSIITGNMYQVEVGATIVDATYSKTEVPSMRPPAYKVAAGVHLVTPNALASIERGYANYTVVGAGKTSIDSVLWLLENGVDPSIITWIIPRDPMLIERDAVQPDPQFAEKAQARLKAVQESIMEAESVQELLEKQFTKGLMHRLDETVWPTMYHCSSVSLLELDAIRKITSIIRKGRVTSISPDKVILENGTYTPVEDTLYIDCSASAVPKLPPVPVFQPNLITLQPVRFCQQTFSAAFIAHVETTYHPADTSTFKNSLTRPIPMPNFPLDHLLVDLQTNINLLRWAQQPQTQAWLKDCRLDFYGQLVQPPEGIDEEVFGRQMLEGVAAASKKLWELFEKMPREGEGKEGRRGILRQLEGFEMPKLEGVESGVESRL